MNRAGRRAVALAAALWCIAPLRAQNAPAQPPTFDALMIDAQRAFATRALDDAAAKFQAIADRGHAEHDELWEARGISGIAAVAFERAQYADARRFAHQALDVFGRLASWPDVSRVTSLLGSIAANLGQEDEARREYDRSIAAAERAGDPRRRLGAAFNRARLEHDDTLLIADLEGLDAEARRLGDAGFEAAILHLWGDRLYNLGEYEDAIEKLDGAAEKFQQTHDLDSLSSVYNSLGRLYRTHGQPAAALQYQLKALRIQERLDIRRSRIQCLNAVAVSYGALGNTAKARQYYERALALAERSSMPNVVAFLRGNFGAFLVDTGELDRGRALLEESIAAGPAFQLSIRYAALSNAYYKMRRFPEALTAADQALATCKPGTRVDCIYAHLRRADAEVGLGHVDRALNEQNAALDMLDELHATLARSDFLKQGFNAAWAPVYSFAIDLQMRKRDWPAALETAEKARSRAFLDLMASRDDPPMPRDHAAPSPAWRGTAADPIALRSDAVAAPSSIGDLTAIARRYRSTLVEYWLGERRTYVWVVPPDGTIHGVSVDVDQSKIERLVRSVTSSPATGRAQAAAWTTLYDVLIQPVEQYLPRTNGARLTLVPHGPLFQLPFAALKDRQGRYLVERFTLSSVPSTALLRFTSGRRLDTRASGALLLVADPSPLPSIPGDARLPRLPGAVDEVRAIARLLPASRTTTLVDADASESRVLNGVRGKAVIHLATHAIVRDADPLSSFLAVGAPDRRANGKLTAKKIYGLALNADLVVLSACRSGGGVLTGDGIASLARAFFYAGTSSLIVSVSEVADESAKRLLPAFYRAWLAGDDKDVALRKAQLEIIRDLRAGRVTVSTPAGDIPIVEQPALWAGFVLLGEPR